MNQLPRIAFTYYDTFESYRSFRAVNKGLLATATIAGMISITTFAGAVLFAVRHQSEIPRWCMILSIGTMLVGFCLMVLVRQQRDAEAIRRVNGLIKLVPASTLPQAKSALLSHLFAQPPTSFLSIAESVRKCTDYSSGSREPLSFRAEDILLFVYSPEARGRVLSLFLTVVTLFAGLILFNAEMREEALQIVFVTSSAWLPLWLTGVFAFVGLYAMVATFFAFVRLICDLVSRRVSTPYQMNPALIRYLIKDLAIYHDWGSPLIFTPAEQKVQLLLSHKARTKTSVGSGVSS